MNAYSPYRFRIKLQNLLIALSLTLAGVALLVTATVFYSDAQVLISEKLDAIHGADFNQITSEIVEFYESSGKVAELLHDNKQLASMIHELEYEHKDLYQKSELVGRINGYLMNLTTYNKAIKSINILTPAAEYYSGRLLFNQAVTEQLSARQIEGVKFEYLRQPAGSESSQGQHVPLNAQRFDIHNESYYITSIQLDGKFYGNVVVVLQKLPLLHMTSKKNDIMIVDDQGQAVYRGQMFSHFKIESVGDFSRDNREIVKLGRSNEPRIYYMQTIKFNNWDVYYGIDNKVYRNQMILLFAMAIVSFLVCLVLSFLFSRYTARRIVRPMASLASYMKRYRVGEASVDRSIYADLPRKMSLREKVFYYFLVSIIIPVGGFIIIFHLVSSSMLSRQIIMDYRTAFETTAAGMTSYMEKEEKLLFGQSYSNLVQDYLQAGTRSEDLFYDMVEQYMFLGMDGTLSLYDTNNLLLLSSRFRQEPQMDGDDYRLLQSVRHQVAWSRDEDPLGAEVVKLGLNITDLLYLKSIGYAQLEIPLDKFTELYAKLSMGKGSTLLFDGKRVVDGNRQWDDLVGENLDGASGMKPISWLGKSNYMFYQQLASTPFYLVSFYNKQDVAKQSGIVLINNVYLLIVLMLTLLILSFTISWGLLNPVNKINNSLHISNLAQLKRMPTDLYVIDEVYELADNFNQLLERIEDLVDDVLVVSKKKHEAEISKNAADIRALQAQINPHFLQNTLDNTIYMIQEGHASKAINMIQSLSYLFRYGISRGETIIPLSEEIKYAKAYAAIMEMRYGEGIQIKWDVEEAVLRFNTLKLILQPLIENAIHHGFREHQGSGTIVIACRELEQQIVITVTDNGKGIPADKLETLRNRLLTGEKSESMGILNVQERLRLSFGPPHGVELDSKPGEYTQAVLNIPKLLDQQIYIFHESTINYPAFSQD